jgi:hypothetical protein
VNKFCTDMETTPVGVIVGLFQAISQKLPAFSEWDTNKHHHLLNSNPAVCDTMTEVRENVTRHGMSSHCLQLVILFNFMQKATFEAVSTVPSTARTSTAFPTNSCPNLSFVPTNDSLYVFYDSLRYHSTLTTV